MTNLQYFDTEWNTFVDIEDYSVLADRARIKCSVQQMSLDLPVIQMTNYDLPSNVMDVSFLLEQPCSSATGSDNSQSSNIQTAIFLSGKCGVCTSATSES